jgi:deoxyadenosine/deoxycytidine kinase
MTAAAKPAAALLPAHLRHIVIEGPIGVGKTTLARRLADRLDARLMLEAPEDNPFLDRFYRDGTRYALPTQMFFLFQRVQQQQTLAQPDLFDRLVIGDYLLDKDRLFARLTLDADELRLYEQLHAHLAPSPAAPDLVIYLQAPPERLVERVGRRGLRAESGLTAAYLRDLSDAYVRFFHAYVAAPLLTVNTEHLNPADRDADVDLLLQRIGAMRGRREFFNLAA